MFIFAREQDTCLEDIERCAKSLLKYRKDRSKPAGYTFIGVRFCGAGIIIVHYSDYYYKFMYDSISVLHGIGQVQSLSILSRLKVHTSRQLSEQPVTSSCAWSIIRRL